MLDLSLAKAGLTRDEVPRNSSLGKTMRRKGVIESSDFRRIDALPRRVWSEYDNLQDLTQQLTEHLRKPKGMQTLFPIQAITLLEAIEHGGVLAGLRTGAGKTLPSFLLATVLESKRPVLFVPAKLRTKTEHDLQAARENWQVPDNLQVMTYEDLSVVAWADWLMNYQPDLVAADEAHKLKADDSARAIRMERFLDAFPTTKMGLFSGTFIDKSPRDAAKLAGWALGKRSPFPLTWKDTQDWDSALNPKARMKLQPGALARWASPEECKTAGGVRRAVGRRITETPGVIMSTGEGVNCGLNIEALDVAHPEMQPALDVFAKTDAKPDGWVVNDAPVRWGVEQCLELGFYYFYSPYPPKEWCDARREWNALVRELVKDRQTLIDSELQAWNACLHAERQPEIWKTWRDIKDTFEPNQQAEWISTKIVERAAEWLHRRKGIVWTQFVAFGQKLSELSGAPYYKDDGCDAFGNSIVHAQKGPAICSVQACGEGLNLQDRWHENLYPMPMASGKDWEQTLARTHRLGQPQPEVSAEVWIPGKRAAANFAGAIQNELSVADQTLDTQRKLVIATKMLPESVIKLQKAARFSEIVNFETERTDTWL